MTNATARVWKQSAKELELQLALAFTEAYKSHRKAHPAWREAMCLDTQFPGRLDDIRPEDLIAGRKRPGFIVMFSPQVPSVSKGDQCAYCFDSCGLPEATGKAGDAARKDAERLTEFWYRECTWQKVQDGLDEELRQYLETDFPPRVLAPGSSRMGYGGGLRIAGVMLDFGLLLRGGIPGLRAQVTERKQQAQREASDTVLFDSMLVALDVVVKSCLYYRDQAESLMGQADGARRAELRAMADALDAVSRRAPASFREAIQLFWLYSVIADVFNYARLDVCLGDFYAHDLDAGVLSESEAKRLLVSLWLLIDDT